MKKKAWLICLMLFLLLTGCGKDVQSSPESLGKEIAKKLSNGEYESILEFIDVEENVFMDKDSFVSYLDEENLTIEGNEKIEMHKTTEDDDEHVTVEIKIDNYKILKINTVKKNNKWYVQLDKYDFKEDLTIAVPTGATVKLNDTVLAYGTYGTSDDLRVSYDYSGSSYYDYFDIDLYTIPQILKGEYNLKVTHDSFEDIDTTIDLTSYFNSDSTNFYSTYSYDYAVRARLKSDKAEIVKTSIKNYYEALINAVNNGNEFSTLEKYFSSESSAISKTKSEYKTLIGKKTTNGSTGTFTTVTLGELKYVYDYVGVYHSGDAVIAFVEYSVKYSADQETNKSYKAIIHLVKDGDSYKIEDGKYLVPSI